MDFLLSKISFLPILLLVVLLLMRKKLFVAVMATMLVAFYFPMGLFSFYGISVQLLVAVFLILIINISERKNQICNKVDKLVGGYRIVVICSVVLYLGNLIFCSDIPFKIIGTITTVLTCVSSMLIAYSCVTFIKDKKDFSFLSYIVIIIALLASVYSLWCYNVGLNPFGIYLQSLFDYAEDYSGDARGALEGRVQGFQTHPLHFAGSLLCAIFVAYMSFFKEEKKIIKCLIGASIVLLIVTLFYTGCRSGIVACFLGLGLFYAVLSGRKLPLYVIIVLAAIYILGIDQYLVSDKSGLLYSVTHFWEQNDDMSGSSLDMRIAQLEGTEDMVFQSPQTSLFGRGVNWCNAYTTKYGHHPVLEGFESILFKWPIEFGIIGFIMMCYIMFGKPYTLIKSVNMEKEKLLLKCYLLSFLVFTVMTGCYAIDLFIVSFALILGYARIKINK